MTRSLAGLRDVLEPVDTGNDLLNAIQRGARAQSRVAEQNQADEDAGYSVPWWAQRRLATLGGWDAGSQIIEGQNEIADTGQKTRVGFSGSKGPRNSPSFMGLQQAIAAQKQHELQDWAKNGFATPDTAWGNSTPVDGWSVGTPTRMRTR